MSPSTALKWGSSYGIRGTPGLLSRMMTRTQREVVNRDLGHGGGTRCLLCRGCEMDLVKERLTASRQKGTCRHSPLPKKLPGPGDGTEVANEPLEAPDTGQEAATVRSVIRQDS